MPRVSNRSGPRGITIMKSAVLMNCIAVSVNNMSPARSTPILSGKAGSAGVDGATVLLAFTAGTSPDRVRPYTTTVSFRRARFRVNRM